MTAPRQDLIVQEGETWAFSCVWRRNGSIVNLTGYTARASIRTAYSGTLVMDLSTANGRMVLGGPDGAISLSLSAADTAGMLNAVTPWLATYEGELSEEAASQGAVRRFIRKPSEAAEQWVYDVDVISPAGVVSRVMQGRCFAFPAVGG